MTPEQLNTIKIAMLDALATLSRWQDTDLWDDRDEQTLIEIKTANTLLASIS